jgi:hypothetical protein
MIYIYTRVPTLNSKTEIYLLRLCLRMVRNFISKFSKAQTNFCKYTAMQCAQIVKPRKSNWFILHVMFALITLPICLNIY